MARRSPDWLRTPAAADGVSHLLYGRWLIDRSLQVHFPRPLDESAGAYTTWARSALHPAIGPEPLLEAASAYPADPEARPLVEVEPGRPLHGLNIHGYLDSELSLGHVARAVVRSAAEVGMSFDLAVDRNAHGSHGHDGKRLTRSTWAHDINVLCVNADRTPNAVHVLGRATFEHRLTAGLWFWEAPQFPESVQEAFDLVDEVWAPSRYVADAVRAFGREPRPVTLPVPVPTWTTTRSRADLGLPPGFLVLCSFDWMSVSERKNPLGALDAYTRAFGPDDGATLVFKTMNGDLGWRDLDALRLAIAERPDVHLIDDCVRSWEVTAIPPALRLLPVPAPFRGVRALDRRGDGVWASRRSRRRTRATWTSWIPTWPTSCPPTSRRSRRHVTHYGGLGEWAEPDIDVAAELLRRVHDDPSGTREGRDARHKRTSSGPGALPSRGDRSLRQPRGSAPPGVIDGEPRRLGGPCTASRPPAPRTVPPPEVRCRTTWRRCCPRSAPTRRCRSSSPATTTAATCSTRWPASGCARTSSSR